MRLYAPPTSIVNTTKFAGAVAVAPSSENNRAAAGAICGGKLLNAIKYLEDLNCTFKTFGTSMAQMPEKSAEFLLCLLGMPSRLGLDIEKLVMKHIQQPAPEVVGSSNGVRMWSAATRAADEA
ncbi:hypothetical protein BJ742DRAFT_776170 [Cladochytrium replicatum]|nr:hypothetical protein BJ742DRAFT_776170 [Cladochytrium replicatum]